ncbi:disks large-associated protein 5 isoform 3-T3 [Pholidichthys leucotaenia]
MASRFANLRERDASVPMLRVKMSRRRSQSLKENRERVVNTRRQLDKLPELESSSMDASIAGEPSNVSTIQEKTMNNGKAAKIKAEERLKQLERWKERKALEKEKEKREREHKGIFKTGVYHPNDMLFKAPLPVFPDASARVKEKKLTTAPSQNIRVTRSMKRQEHFQKLQPLNMQDPNALAKKERSTRTQVASVKPALNKTNVSMAEPVVQSLSTNRAAVAVVKGKPKEKAADVRSRAAVNLTAPLSGRQKNCTETVSSTMDPAAPKDPEEKKADMQGPEEKPSHPSPENVSEVEDMMVDQASTNLVPHMDDAEPQPPKPTQSSFAPDGFVFEAPTGLSSFKFEPLTPRSADAFLTPSSSFNLPPAPVFSFESRAEPKSPHHTLPRTPPTVACPTPDNPLESKHNVPYFRSEIEKETDRLTTLCLHWESKVEDELIPEEMRDRMRTAVGQARLLMKERFNQFSGLVDDCDFSRGEKLITCVDLQGFWDMVYYQVEDVNKKFNALKEAEARDWTEEHKSPQRQRKVVKKQSAATFKPAGTKAAAKSRLAAVKAAMKAKRQAAEAEKAITDGGNSEDNPTLSAQEVQHKPGAQTWDKVVFDGGFFKVESPAKPPGSVRRSSCLSAAVLPEPSPCKTYLSPRRVTQRSFALAQTPVQDRASPAQSIQTPPPCLTPRQTPGPKPQSETEDTKNTVTISLHFSPVKEEPSQTNERAHQPETVSTQEDPVSVPESLPIISFVQEDNTPPEAPNGDLPLSPRRSVSPCKTPPSVCQGPAPSGSLSFMPSPCASPSPLKTQQSVCHTPDSLAMEKIPGLDMEHYLQPSERCSLSPTKDATTEILSPMAVDVEMESPRGQPLDQESVLPAVSSVLTLQAPQVQTAESALLLFTPDVTDRIRQSVCPSDLMVFTPPNI